MNILLVGFPTDYHMQQVKWGLVQRGISPYTFHPADLSKGSRISLKKGCEWIQCNTITNHDFELAVSAIDVVWFRDAPTFIPFSHLDDPAERASVEMDYEHLLTSIYTLLGQRAFCINPYDTLPLTFNKPLQMRTADGCGMRVPGTLVSNDLHEIGEFLEAHGRLLYKPLSCFRWWVPDKGARTCRNVVIEDMSLFDDVDTASVAGIYQQIIDKKFEVRLVIFGEEPLYNVFKATGAAPEMVDWRWLGGRIRVTDEYVLPEHVIQMCRDVMKALGLVLGIFDLAVDQNDEVHFLEVNQRAQFLADPKRIKQFQLPDTLVDKFDYLDAFIDFMLSRNPSFRYERRASGALDVRDFTELLVDSRNHFHGGFNYPFVPVSHKLN